MPSIHTAKNISISLRINEMVTMEANDRQASPKVQPLTILPIIIYKKNNPFTMPELSSISSLPLSETSEANPKHSLLLFPSIET